MLAGLALGMLWGAIIADFFVFNVSFFLMMRQTLIILFGVILLVSCSRPASHRYLKILFFTCSGALWTTIHSPPPVQVKDKVYEVLWSQGCGDLDEVILLRDHETLVYARGSAVEGDLVELSRQSLPSTPPTVTTLGISKDSGVVCRLTRMVRGAMIQRITRFPSDLSAWLTGFVLGRKSDLDTSVVKSFRNTGLLHALVLSGGHLAIVANLSLMLLRILINSPYALRMITVRTFSFCWSISVIASLLVVLLFCLVVGFSPSVQRAFMAVFVMNIPPMFGFAQRLRTRIKLSFVAQAIFFPCHILSISMILSWSCSMLLMAFFESLFLKSLFQKILQSVLIQLGFFGLSLIFFGSVGILSPVANLLGLTIFGFLLPYDLFAIFIESSVLDQLTYFMNMESISWVIWMDYYQSTMPIPFLTIPKRWTLELAPGRILLVALISAFYFFAGLKYGLSSRRPRRYKQRWSSPQS